LAGKKGKRVGSLFKFSSNQHSKTTTIGALIGNLNRLLSKSLAPSTQKVYNRAWALYWRYASEVNLKCYGLTDLPFSSQNVAMFVSYLNIKCVAPSTMVSYTCAIGYVHKMAGYYDPTTSTLVQKLLRAAIMISPSIDVRLPITKILLLRLVQSVDSIEHLPYLQALIRAMFVIAFFGLMRVEEITKDQLGQVAINLNQVKVCKHNVIITITKFKYNIKKQPFDLLLPCQDQDQICPVHTLCTYLKLRGIQDGPLFVFPDNKPITRNYFVGKLKSCLSFCGLDTTKFKSHSFRIGAASYYASLGYSDTQIRIIGRWNSDAFKRYIRCQRIQGPC
jgi:hypothetical protein